MLVVIAALEPVPTPRVADYMAMDRTTICRNIKPLSRAGYLELQHGAGRRPGIVSLSEAGHTVLAEANPLWQAAQGDLTRRVGAGRAGELLEVLGQAVADK